MDVPNTTETPRKYARRQLYDLAHVIGHLDTENWDNPDERRAVIRGLQTYAEVLYKIANHIEDSGVFE